MENNELKKVWNKNCTCYCFDDLFKLEEINLDNILIDENSHEIILIYDTSYKTLIGSKTLRLRFDQTDGTKRIYDRTRYLALLGTKEMRPFTTELEIL